jgi:two-component system NtrC family sensor kinase
MSGLNETLPWLNGVTEQIRQREGWASYLPRLSGLQGKLIFPYVILTLVIAMVGTYVVTRLVTSSIRERFVNQLYEASNVAADSVIRQERDQLEYLRLMAFTEGVPQAFANGDTHTLEDLLLPLVLNGEVEILTAVNLDGEEILTLGLDPISGQYYQAQGADMESYDMVQNVLTGYSDDQGDKFIGLVETRYGTAIVTSAPVRDESGELLGALLVGTRLENLLSETKTQALADVILLNDDQELLVTTLAEPDEGYDGLIAAAETSAQEDQPTTLDLELFGREYQVFFSPFEVRNQSAGWLGVILPSNYVVSTEATSRNLFSLLFALGTTAVIIIGYMLSQSIARPILRLRSASQAVASGDLEQTVGLERSDEIGELADSFDTMTLHLRERTEEAARLYEETAQRNKELAEINAQLQATQLQLIQSEKLGAVGQLTAGIVHDVKNPLTVIKGMAELLEEEEGLTEETREELRVIRDSAVKANRIVSDLLTFARQSSPEMKTHDLRETIEASLRLTAYLTRKAHVQVESDLPEKPIYVTYDPQQIEQVFINMISNAVHAMSDRGTLLVSMMQNDGMAAVSFKDDGTGIKPDNINRIFDPFFTTKPEGEGTGLGLSVSYGIITNHRGRIEVESQLGEGSTFNILLPVDRLEELAGDEEL